MIQVGSWIVGSVDFGAVGGVLASGDWVLRPRGGAFEVSPCRRCGVLASQ